MLTACRDEDQATQHQHPASDIRRLHISSGHLTYSSFGDLLCLAIISAPSKQKGQRNSAHGNARDAANAVGCQCNWQVRCRVVDQQCDLSPDDTIKRAMKEGSIRLDGVGSLPAESIRSLGCIIPLQLSPRTLQSEVGSFIPTHDAPRRFMGDRCHIEGLS